MSSVMLIDLIDLDLFSHITLSDVPKPSKPLIEEHLLIHIPGQFHMKNI